MKKRLITIGVTLLVAVTILVVLLVVLHHPTHPTQEHNSSNNCNLGPSLCRSDLRYRSLDGSCNNLMHPQWGMAYYKYGRLLPAKYGDGIYTPKLSVSGRPLPNARTLSLTLYGSVKLPDPNFTLFNMQWGQVVAHDMSRTYTRTENTTRNSFCCSESDRFTVDADGRSSCYTITIPTNDRKYTEGGAECFRFIKSITDRDTGCDYNGGPAEQLTVTTSFIDLSLVYGNSVEQNRALRAWRGGRMAETQSNGQRRLPELSNPKNWCMFPKSSEACYLAGDDRANITPGLIIIQTILVMEHNRLADALATLNPHWDDSALFEEARKINIAQFQYITYYEWMPNFLGNQNMLNHRLIYSVPAGRFISDYNPQINPAILNEHASAAFRFHNQIVGRWDMFSEARDLNGSLRFKDWARRPAIINVEDNFDKLTRGIVTQHAGLTDLNFESEITQHLFETNTTGGKDLHAFDIYRGRVRGLASYNDMREFCGLRRALEWKDFEDLIDPQLVQKLQSVYESLDDVDLIVGGSFESHVEDALAGPTFLCIMTEQFFRARTGDRFFFENSDSITGFTPDQLEEIRKASAARILCDNSNIESIQSRAFRVISDSNPLVSCADIPQINLNHWIDTSIREASTSEKTLTTSVK